MERTCRRMISIRCGHIVSILFLLLIYFYIYACTLTKSIGEIRIKLMVLTMTTEGTAKTADHVPVPRLGYH